MCRGVWLCIGVYLHPGSYNSRLKFVSLRNGVEIRVGDVLRSPIVATVPRPLIYCFGCNASD